MNGDRLVLNANMEIIGSAEAYPGGNKRFRSTAARASRKRARAARAARRAANRASGLTSDGKPRTF